MTNTEKLIKQIVDKLRNLGFVHVNKHNIITDEVYSQYFIKILHEKLGESEEADLIINQLLTTVNQRGQTI